MSRNREFSTHKFQHTFTLLQQLLAEAYKHERAGHRHRNSEGAIRLLFPEFYGSSNNDKRIGVEIFTYCLGGGGRSYVFNNIDAAVQEVHKWLRQMAEL
ncbi:hypothetical protein DL991_41205 [Amycolatopsis sp. WAC 01375]|uniref:hypothetical protein n=1 Tax=Amycolatopsis sp. WAC 01375 TaxID=2203194 RepID=UPI000F78E928|nr:hypothetical protein [Amycolatopsis sp. WAC 01375]RSM68690.1 hypothetical protein DL991_41205 [Amycolatopsis sp. WAC 01375]